MPFTELVFLADQISRRSVQRSREIMTGGAYTAWLLGAGGNKSWGDFLRNCGLTDRGGTTKEQRRRIVQKAKAVGSRVMKLDRPIKKDPKK